MFYSDAWSFFILKEANSDIILTMNKFYLTTAIPYVNAKPHVGHALEFVQADAIKRFRKSLGDDVLLLSGADENAI